MNAWGKQSNSDGYEWDGNTFEDDEIALKESICGMTARFLLLHNVQDYERYTTQKEWSDAVIRLTGKTEMEAYRQEIKSLWDEYYSFIRQTEQNEIDPDMDEFTREMEVSFGCSDMMKKAEKIWAELLVCDI